MARIESIAIGGYYPTPTHLIPHIGRLLEPQGTAFTMMDPCAGEGAAVLALGGCFSNRVMYLTCEMEKTRHKILTENMKGQSNWQSAKHVLHGDAFRIDFAPECTNVLFLNPPYDLDPVHGRLEQRFLERFTKALREDGILLFLVPHYALAASAVTLATEYDDLVCLRFPDEDFAAYKQVLLVARKVEARLAPDRKILARVQAWADNVKRVPVLGTTDHKFGIEHNEFHSSTWIMREADVLGLVRKLKPWHYTPKSGAYQPVPHVLPEVPVEDLLFRTFPIATAPRPAHIASGIASGLFNGRKVTPKTPGMPDLLVKGVFDREFVTIEEKTNKDGDVTSVVQVQQPKLVTTVLDLETKKYTTLKLEGKSESTDIESLTIEGLLEHYGPSLMHVMNQQCPVSYDAARDADKFPLFPVERKLFTAQMHAAKALLSLLGGVKARPWERRNKAAILLGEIGSGKTTVALTVGRTIGKCMLVMCPPHLLDSWRDEVLAVAPDAEFRILQNISDVDDLVNTPKDKFTIAVLSREVAKLGHGWDSVTGACPKCGSELPEGDLSKKRERCEARPLELVDEFAQKAFELAMRMAPSAPSNGNVETLLSNRNLRRYLATMATKAEKPEWPGFDVEWVDQVLSAKMFQVDALYLESVSKLFGRLLLANYNPQKILELINSIECDRYDYQKSTLLQSLTMLLEPGSELHEKAREHEAFQNWTYYHDTVKRISDYGFRSSFGTIHWREGVLTLDECEPGSIELAEKVLSKLCNLGKFVRPEKPCGEPLFQAVPEPRRYALSRYISKRHPRLFDFMVLDEGHEYATDGSAQERSAHRLTALGIPTLLMTGSIMNGYAESLFTNMWALSADFRGEFARDERQRFIDRYGYRKRILTDRDRQTGDIVEFGAHTDRVERSERNVGDAPGILPLFLFRHLLKFSVTLHKADLAIDLPKCHQHKQVIQPDEDVLASYKRLQQALITAIRKDQFTPERAGKLFGALAELPSYLDRATTDAGNQEDGTYAIRYPESVGGEVVCQGDSFDPSRIMAKERWILDKVRDELAEGRNVMVFCWHVNLLPRLARLISEEIGEEVPILYANKVPTGKRQEWINKNVVRKNRRVMVANPVAIQTGLNNLVHFATEIWHENPAVNPIITRQAVGRIDRIGQKKETRVFFPVYAGTLQINLYDLLMRKIVVSVSTDGLDNESVLLAAGATSDGYLAGLSIGKQLWNMLNQN